MCEVAMEIVASGPGAWTEIRLELLRKLNGTMSNEDIASHINAETGSLFTRNSIIGRRAKEGLCVKREAAKPKPKRREAEPDLLAMFGLAPPPQLEFLDYDLDQLSEDPRACRYPIGDAHPYAFCGQTTGEKSSYCPYHHSICYEKPQRKSRPEQRAGSQWERWA